MDLVWLESAQTDLPAIAMHIFLMAHPFLILQHRSLVIIIDLGVVVVVVKKVGWTIASTTDSGIKYLASSIARVLLSTCRISFVVSTP